MRFSINFKQLETQTNEPPRKLRYLPLSYTKPHHLLKKWNPIIQEEPASSRSIIFLQMESLDAEKRSLLIILVKSSQPITTSKRWFLRFQRLSKTTLHTLSWNKQLPLSIVRRFPSIHQTQGTLHLQNQLSDSKLRCPFELVRTNKKITKKD